MRTAVLIEVCLSNFISELYWGKAMVVYTKPQQGKKGDRLRGEREIRSSY